MSLFTGSGVALITPFQNDGTIDYDRLRELLEFQISHDTDAVIICGTTGEAATMTKEERLACVRFTCDCVGKRVPVIVGTGHNCTQVAAEQSKQAVEAGADGILVVTPYYNKATQKGLIEHYTYIASRVDAPMILYNVPGRTGCNIEAETAAHLIRRVENIVGIKEASGDMSQVAAIVQLTHGELDLYSGNDDQIVPLLSLGAKGVISVLANVAPKETHGICEKYFAGKLQESLDLQLKALPLIWQLFCEVNPIPVKKGVNLMGIEAGIPRLPLTEMEPEHAKKLAQAMREFGILEAEATRA